MSVDRRTFLKRIAMVSAAAAGSGAAPGARLLGSSPVADAGSGPVWHRAPCRLCGVGCGLLVGIQDGRAVAAKADPESPVNRGLACVKGYHAVQAMYGADRLTRALIRRDGTLRPAPLAEALDLVARRIRESIAAHGKDSVAMYGSGGWTITDAYAAAKLFKGGIGTNNVDGSLRLHAATAMTALESSFGADGPIASLDDIDRADVFVLWDENLAETAPVLFSRMLERRRKNPGVRIVELNTRTTRTSYASDRSLVHAPQTELAILNALCQEIVSRRLESRDFVNQHVTFRTGSTGSGAVIPERGTASDASGEATWSDFVRFLARYTPERAERLSGVPTEDIRWLASLYGDRSRNVVSVWGTSLDEQGRGTWANNLLFNLHLLVGKIARPGNGAISISDQGACGSMELAGALSDGLPRGRVTNARDRADAARTWAVPASRIDPRPGFTALSMFRALERGDVRVLWIQGSNPLGNLPNLDRYRRAATKADRFIVVSDAYPTATTAAADVVLPSALWIEREGIVGSAGRRLQHFPEMVTPPGDALSDGWQIIEIARRLGFGGLFPWRHDDHVAGLWEEYRRFHRAPATSLPALAELSGGTGLVWPVIAGRETNWRFNTGHDAATGRRSGGFDFYGHADRRARIWLRPYEPPIESPDHAYPFWLEMGRVLEQSGTASLTGRVPVLHRAMPEGYVEMNRADAQAIGVRSRDIVRLVSRRGAVELPVRIDFRSQPPRGRLFAPAFDAVHPVHRLASEAGCPLAAQPDTRKCAVRVERVEARRT